MQKFVLGIVTGWLLLLIGGVIIVTAGLTPIAATWLEDGKDSLKDFLAYTTRQAIERSAEPMANPFAGQEQAIIQGADEFSSHCLHCHGGAEAKPAEWARGLVPQAPDIDSRRMQSLSESEMFWVIKHGIHSTGMPHFNYEEDEELWKMVSFLKAVDQLPEGAKKALKAHKHH